MPVRDTAWPAGTPCWVDYAAADLGAAEAFYGGLLGWDYTEALPEHGNYVIASTAGRDAAGMMPRMPDADQPAWTTYFATDDADATAAAVAGAGGTVVVPPMDVGPQGRMAVFLDPQGLLFGVWQAGERTGMQVFGEPGALGFNGAATPDPDGALAFYGEVLGFQFDEVESADDSWSFSAGDGRLGSLGRVCSGSAPEWGVCFVVASADDAVSTTERQGGEVVQAAEDTSFGRFAALADPWGAAFSVIQRPA